MEDKHEAVGLAGFKYQNQRPWGGGVFSLTVGTCMDELSLFSRTTQGFWAPEVRSSLLGVPETLSKGEEEAEAEANGDRAPRGLQDCMKDSRNR